MKKDLRAANIRSSANWITFLFILFLITNFHTTFRSRVAIADVETETIRLSEKEIADLKTLTYYYDATLSKPTSKEREKKDWIAPANDALFSSVFTDMDTFFELRKKYILNKKNLSRINNIIKKAIENYDGKTMSTISFEYKGYKFKFPISVERSVSR
ncbi:MAG: hypothetical protein ACLU31_03290 [Ezakiella sp.]